MKYKIALVLVSLLVLTVPVSANVTCPWGCDQYSGLGWNDTFTLDSRTAYYTSQTTGFSVTGGELQSTTNSNQMFRNDKTLANGSFIWNLSSTGPNAEENNPGCIFGSLSGTDAWGWWDTGNKYEVSPVFKDNFISLNKIVAGAATWITGNSVNLNPNIWYNITAEWYPQGATKIRVWVNGTQMFTSNDATFTTTGYAGVGTWWQNTATMKWTEFFFTYSPAPLSNFTSTTHECTGTCSLTFTDDSSRATVVDRNWTINGSIATGGGGNPQAITLTPPATGSITYTVCLNTTASPYTDIDQAPYGWNLSTTCWPVVVSPSVIAPVAAFSCVPLNGAVPLDVTCTDASTNTPTSWSWRVENETTGDGLKTSAVQNPTFGFSVGGSGTFSVNLSATNAAGSDWENKSAYIVLTEPVPPTPPPPTNCTATFSVNVTEGWPPLPVKFTISGNITIIDSVQWSFGDGGTSIDWSPEHVFSQPGSWTVTAALTNTTYTETCTIKRFNLIDILKQTFFPHLLYVALLFVLMGGIVYTVLDNQNRYYGNIVIGTIITVLAFYLAYLIMAGAVAVPVVHVTSTNHTILNSTVTGDVNLSYTTTDTETLDTAFITIRSQSFGWLLVMLGLINAVIVTLNSMEIIFGVIQKRER